MTNLLLQHLQIFETWKYCWLFTYYFCWNVARPREASLCRAEQNRQSDPKRPICLLFFCFLFLHLMMKTRPCTVHFSIEYNKSFTIYTHWNMMLQEFFLNAEKHNRPVLFELDLRSFKESFWSTSTIGQVRQGQKKNR